MNILLYNISWMTWNSFLALIGVYFGYGMFTMKNKFMKYLFFVLWLLFIPNTIYILTDMVHILNLDQLFRIEFYLIPLLVMEYLFLLAVGIMTYIYSLHYFEQTLAQFKFSKTHRYIIICFLNFMISFGVILGRFQRTNSWEVITHPIKVTNDIMATFFTTDHLLYILSFGFFCCLLYFGLRKKLIVTR